MNEKRPGLVQGLGPSAAMAMVVGHIIGTGAFLVPSAMTRATGSVALVFLGSAVRGALPLFGALSIAELGAAMPAAGGADARPRRAPGPGWGPFFGSTSSLGGTP